MKKSTFIPLAAAILALFSSPQTHASNVTWSGTTNGAWSTATNWSGGVAPVNGDNVIFTGGSNLNTTNDLTGLSLSTGAPGEYSLRIQSTPAVTIGGNQLTIGSGNAGEIALFGGNHTISADLNLADISVLVRYDGTQTLSGVMSGTRGAGGPDEINFWGSNDTDRIILTGNSTYNPFNTIIYRGIVQVNSLGNADQAGSLGKSPYIRASALNWNSAIDYVGAGDSTNRQIRFGESTGVGDTGGFSLLNNGSGALVFTNATLNNYIPGQNVLGNRTFTLGGNNTDNNEIQSIITNNKATGNGTGFSDTAGTIGITKSGTGKWILSGNNTYTGTNTVSAGLLIAAHANALGSTYAGTTVSSGASLGLQGNITTAAEALSINGTGVGSAGALRNISGTNTYAGDVTLAGDSTIGADAGSLTVSGAVTGTGQALTIVGGGSVTLSNASNTFGSALTGITPGLVVNGGTLKNGVDNAVNSNLIVQVKSGTWDLNGYNQTVRSEWGGGLLLGGAAGSSAPTVTTGTGTLTIQGEAVSGAQARIDYSSAGNPLGGVVNGNVSYSSPNNILAVVVGDSTNADIDLTINAVISKVGGGGGGFFLKGDTGTLLLNGLNTFNVAAPRVDAGTLILGVNDPANGSAGALGQGTAQVTVGINDPNNYSASLLLRDGVTTARSVRTQTNTQTGHAADTRTLGGYDSTGTATFSGPIELFNAANDGGTTRLQALGTSTIKFTGAISDNPGDTAVGINKIGSGTVVLAGTDTYRGATTITNGTLQIGDGGTTGAVGSTSGIAVSGGAILAFNRTDNYGGNFGRQITGAGGIVLTAGNLTLSNNTNSFNGGVTINGGKLMSVAGAITASNSVVVNSGGTFGMGASDTWGNAGTLNTPAVTINSGGNLTSDGQFNSLRNLTLNGGTVTLNGGLAAAGAFTLGGTVTASGAVTSTINTSTGSNNFIRLGREGVVAGVTEFNVSNAAGQLLVGADLTNNFGASTAALTKSGSGTLILAGANTYTGNTTVSEGTLLINGSTASSVVSVSVGATLGGNGTIGGATTVNGFLAPGNSPGVLTFNSTLTLASTATTTMEINGSTRGTQYDGIDMGSNALTYGGNLTLSIGTTFAQGNYTFDLFNFGGTQTGSFASGGVTLTGNYTGTLINNGSGIWSLASGNETWTFTQSTGDLGLLVVPEPSTWLLFGCGLGALVILRRRRQMG